MGSQTVPVMVGCLAIHVALVLIVCSVFSPYWLESQRNESVTSNETLYNVTANKGLWLVCVNEECNTINETLQAGWFRTVQGLEVSGTVTCLVSAALFWVLLSATNTQNSQFFTSGMLFSLLLTLFALLTGVILFGVRARSDTSDMPENEGLQFGWTYYLAAISVVAVFISTATTLQRYAIQRSQASSYETIA